MRRLIRRINFRLTFQEEERYVPLMKTLHVWGWSELCRMALRRLAAAEEEKQRPNNSVIPPIGGMTKPATSDTAKKKSPRSTRQTRKKPGK